MKEEHGKEVVEKSKGKEIRFNIETDREGRKRVKRIQRGN